MHDFRLVLPVLLLAGVLCQTHAETITITIVQNETAPAIALNMSQTIEDELLDDYFDNGHIVSNTEIRFDGANFVKPNFGLKEAAFGDSDYLLAVYLEYGPGEKRDEEKNLTWAELVSLEWRLVRVLRSTVVAESVVEVSKVKITDFDPYQQSRMVADLVSEQSLGAIQKAKQGEKNK